MIKCCGNLMILTFLLLLIQKSFQQDLVAGVSISDSQNRVNQQATYRYTIIPSDLSFEVGTVIQTYLPTTVSLILSNSNTISVCRRFIKLTNTFETLNSCTYNHDQSMIQFTISSRIEFDVAYEYEIAYILNPGISTLVTGFRIVVNDQNGNNLYDTTVTSSAVYIQPGDLLNQSVSDSSLKVSDTGIFTFKFQISNKIPGNGLFQVIFPTEIEVPSGISGSDTRIKVYDQDWQTGTIIISSRSITFTNALKGNILTPITGSYVQIEIQKVINPKSLKETSSFTIATMDSTYNKIDQVGSSMTIKPTIPGDIQIFSVGPQSNPQVGQTTDISFNIQVAQAYENGGYLLVTFPSEVVIKNLTCFPFIGFVTQDSNCIISSTSPQTVKIQNAVSSTRLYFLISSAQNPSSTKTTSTFTIQAYDSSNFLMSQILSGVNYTSTPASLKSGTSIRSITQVNSATGNNQTISLSITNPLQNGDIILVRIPYEQMQVVSSNFSCEITALGITTRPSCTLDSSSNSIYFIVTLTAPCSSGCAASQNFQLVLNGVKNPSWIQSTTKSIEIYTMTSDQLYTRDRKISGIFTTPSLTEGPINSISIQRNNFYVNSNTEISLTFTPTNTIPNNGYFRIYFSQSSFYDPTSGQILCQDLLTSQSLTCISVQNTDQTQGINYIQINGKCTSSCPGASQISIKITNLRNRASVKSLTNSFSIKSFTSEGYSIDSGISTQATGLDLLPAQFNSLQITQPLSSIVTGAISTYSFRINTQNGITQSTGQLIITFPIEVQITSGSCTAVISSTSLTCSANLTTQQIKITNSNSQNFAGQNIVISLLNAVINPRSTKPSAHFTFKTNLYDSSTTTYYLVEQDLNSIFVTADTPNQLTSYTATRSTFEINQQTELVLQFNSSNPIPQNSQIIFKIPKDQIVFKSSLEPQLFDNLTGTSLTKQSFSNDQSSNSYTTIIVNEWCSGSLTQCPSNTQLTLKISNVFNPASTKLPTMSIQIQIQQEALYYSDQKLSDIFVQPLLSAGPFKDIQISQTSNIIGDSTSATFKVTINNGIPSIQNGTLEIILPDGLFYQYGSQAIICNSDSNILDCSATTQTSIFGIFYKTITFSMNCLSQACNYNTQRSFTIQNLRNRFSRDQYSGSFSIQSSDSEDLSYDASTITFAQTSLSESLLQSQTATLLYITRSNQTVSQKTDISLYFQNHIPIQKDSIIQVYMPKANFLPIDDSNVNPTCKNLQNNTVIECDFNSTSLVNGDYYVVQFKEFCSGSKQLCTDNTTQGLLIQGLQNRYNTKQITDSLQLFIFDPTKQLVYETNVNQLAFTDQSLSTQAVIYNNITSSNQEVGELTNIDIYMNLQNQLLINDQLEFTISAPFVGIDETTQCQIQTPQDTTSSQSCTIVSDSNNKITSIQFDSQQEYQVGQSIIMRLLNVLNLGEVKEWNSNLSIIAKSTDISMIAQAQINFQSLQLKANIFSQINASRNLNDLAQEVTIEISYVTTISIKQNSSILISIPTTQFVKSNNTLLTCKFQNIIKNCDSSNADATFTNFTLNSICDSQNCQANQSQTISIQGFTNPSQVSAIQKSIQLQIISQDLHQIIKQNSFDVQAQPPVKMGALEDLQIIQNSTMVVGDPTNYFIQFKLPSQLTNNDKIYIKFPAYTIKASSNGQISCQNINTKSQLTCSIGETLNNHITLITLNTYCQQADCSKSVLQQIKISNGLNVHYQRMRNSVISVMAVTQSGFVMSSGDFNESQLNSFQIRKISDLKVLREKTSPGQDNVDLTLSFTTKMVIPEGSFLTYTLPREQQNFKDPYQLTCLSGSQTLSCQILTSNDTHIIFKVKEWCSGDCLANTFMPLTIKRTINPSNLALFESSYGLKIDTSDQLKMQEVTEGVQIQPKLDGLAFSNILVSREQNYVGGEDFLKFIVPIDTPISENTDVLVQIPRDVAYYPQNGEGCMVLLGSWNDNFQCDYAQKTNQSYFGINQVQSVLVKNVCSESFPCKSYTSLIFKFKTQNPFTVFTPANFFNLTFLQNSKEIGRSQTTNQLSNLLPNNITAMIVKNQDLSINICDRTGEFCQFQLEINTTNPLISNQNGSSYLELEFPNQIKLIQGSCQANLMNETITCKIVNSTHIKISHSFDTKNIKIFKYLVTIVNLKAPSSTESSDAIQIKTYSTFNAQTYLVDTLKNSLTFQVTQPFLFSNVIITRTNQIPNQATALVFRLTLQNPIPQNGEIFLGIPESQLNLNTQQQVTCQASTLMTTYSKVNCQFDAETQFFTVTNLCNKNGGCLEKSVLVFTMESQSFTNPSFALDVVDPILDSLNITSKYISLKDGKIYLIDRDDQQVYINPTVKTEKLIIENFLVNSINTSDYVQLQFSVKYDNSSKFFTQNYLKLSQSNLTFNKDSFRDLEIQVEGQGSKVIQQNQNSQNDSLSSLIFECNDNCKNKNKISIQISGLKNPYFTFLNEANLKQNQMLLSIFELLEPPSKIISQGSFDLLSQVTSLEISKILNPQIIQQEMNYSTVTNISLIFTLNNRPFINQQAAIIITLPNEYGVISEKLQCSKLTTSEDVQCSFLKAKNQITITQYFGISNKDFSHQTVNLQINGIINPKIQASKSLVVQIQSDYQLYAQDSSNFILKTMMTTTFCNNGCSLCTVDQLTCLSCKKPSDTPLLENSQCLSECLPGYFEMNGLCFKCSDKCLKCQAFEQCTQCESQTKLQLLDGICVDKDQAGNNSNTCPNGTMLNVQGNCVKNQCEKEDCQLCGVTSQFCYYCQDNLVSLNGLCVNQCPIGYFKDQQNTCIKCSSTCKECDVTPDKCLSCRKDTYSNSKLDLSTNKCVSECSGRSVYNPQNPDFCEGCDASCLTCSLSKSNCTSCFYDKNSLQDLFYFNNKCVQSCPIGYFNNYQTHECEEQTYHFLSFPPMYLVSSVTISGLTLIGSKILSGRADVTSEIGISLLTQVEFLNRVFLLLNLWSSTKSFSFCVTCLSIVGNSFLAIYFVTIFIEPICNQLPNAINSKSLVFKSVIVLTQFSGINTARLLTSGFFGIEALSSKIDEIIYYVKHFETISMLSTGLNVFQFFTGVSCVFDFGFSQDSMGLGVNAIIINGVLIAIQTYKYVSTMKVIKSYEKVNQI